MATKTLSFAGCLESNLGSSPLENAASPHVFQRFARFGLAARGTLAYRSPSARLVFMPKQPPDLSG
jgi:hypothetical protein